MLQSIDTSISLNDEARHKLCSETFTIHALLERISLHLKRVLRYLKGMAGHSLLIRKAKTNAISAFSDAEWEVILTIAIQHLDTLFTLVLLRFHGNQ